MHLNLIVAIFDSRLLFSCSAFSFDIINPLVGISKQENKLKYVCLVLQMMSAAHYRIAHAVFAMLHEVALHASTNLMGADNLGSVFAPHMLCSKKVGSRPCEYCSVCRTVGL